MKKTTLFALSFLLFFLSCKNEKAAPKTNLVLIKNGTIYDGLGGEPFVGDVLIQGDTIAQIGKTGTLNPANFKAENLKIIDATGLAVAPGFINMLSWSTETLIEDGRSMS